MFTWSISVPFGLLTSIWLEYWDPCRPSHWCAPAGGDNLTQVQRISFPLLSGRTADRKWRNNKREAKQINTCCHLIPCYLFIYFLLFLIIYQCTFIHNDNTIVQANKRSPTYTDYWEKEREKATMGTGYRAGILLLVSTHQPTRQQNSRVVRTNVDDFTAI